MNISQLDNLKSRSCWTETCLETIHIEHCDRCSLRACWRLLIMMCHVRSDNITWIEVHHGILFDRRLDHDRTLSNGTIGYSVFEVINGKSNALVHQIVQVQGVFAKSYHHANLQNKKRPRLIVQPSTKKKMLQWPTLTDNLWSNIRWQWWQLVVLGRWKRTKTWFHHWFLPRFCGRPVMSHFGNSLTSLSNFRLSIV